MAGAELSRQEWIVAHYLAGNLAVRQVSKNLVLGLREYLARHKDAQPEDYLVRLARLGDAFAGGEDELRQRQELGKIVRQVANSFPELDWLPVLAWTARLLVAYRPEERGRTYGQQEGAIQERIQEEMGQALKRLEAPYYG